MGWGHAEYHDTEIASAVVPGGDGLDVSKGFFNRTFPQSYQLIKSNFINFNTWSAKSSFFPPIFKCQYYA